MYIPLALAAVFIWIVATRSRRPSVTRVKPSGFVNIDRWIPLVELAADKHGVDPALMLSILKVESSGDPAAVLEEKNLTARAGRRVASAGLFQMLNTTAEELRPSVKLDDLFDPSVSADLAGLYIGRQTRRYKGVTEHVAASYNAGSALKFAGGRVVHADDGKFFSDTWQGRPAASHPNYVENTYVNQKYVDRVMEFYRKVAA